MEKTEISYDLEELNAGMIWLTLKPAVVMTK